MKQEIKDLILEKKEQEVETIEQEVELIEHEIAFKKDKVALKKGEAALIKKQIGYIRSKYEKARKYEKTDPDASLINARKTTEAICKQLYSASSIEPKKPVNKIKLDVLIDTLKRNGLLDELIHFKMMYVQRAGNLGAHDRGLEADDMDEEDIAPCLSALNRIVLWYERQLNGKFDDSCEELGHLAQEQAEAERLAQEQAEAERLAQERAEAERLAQERAEAERLAQEQAEAERLAQEQAEAERLAQERAEAERLAQERAEAERLAQERAEAERLAQERAEAERLAQEQAEAERLAQERAEAERERLNNAHYAWQKKEVIKQKELKYAKHRANQKKKIKKLLLCEMIIVVIYIGCFTFFENFALFQMFGIGLPLFLILSIPATLGCFAHFYRKNNILMFMATVAVLTYQGFFLLAFSTLPFKQAGHGNWITGYENDTNLIGLMLTMLLFFITLIIALYKIEIRLKYSDFANICFLNAKILSAILITVMSFSFYEDGEIKPYTLSLIAISCFISWLHFKKKPA